MTSFVSIKIEMILRLVMCWAAAASTHDQRVFSFFPDHRPCAGFEEALSRYRTIVPHLRLAGRLHAPFQLFPRFFWLIGRLRFAVEDLSLNILTEIGGVRCNIQKKILFDFLTSFFDGA